MEETYNKSALKKLLKWLKKKRIILIDNTDNLYNLKKLDLKINELKKIPKEIGELTNLEELDLGYNKLFELPEEITNLTNLTVLKLERNKFTKFPVEITRLVALNNLSLESNQIKNIPPDIKNLSKLSTLNLFYNKLSELPDEIGELTNLKELNLGANNLTSLPLSISKLENLENLIIWSNKITEIPEEIKNLPKLEDIEITVDKKKLNAKLIECIQINDVELAQELIFHGADVNYKDTKYDSLEFTTPLFEAKSIKIIELLLSHNADPHVKREIKKSTASIKVWEAEKEINEFETFLTKKHSLEITKYLKKKKLK
ncbi:MAG: hypothetical protein KAT68_01080 [Bacteroidales bacterium]|nr:hypothetical protein [Bacteroidales bacterium]